MHELRALGVRPDFVTNKAWNRYREYWATAYFKARSENASQNRKSEKDGPGTCPSKYSGGTRSFHSCENALDNDEDDKVTPNDVFLHIHTKDHDEVKLARRCEEHTHATSDQSIDEKQLYYDAAGECSKGRVYGLGQLPRGRGDMKISMSAPPPPPPLQQPQEHHQQVGMDPARSPQQEHDDDDEDIYDWPDEEHLGDEKETMNVVTLKSVEFDEFSIVDDYLSELEETLKVSSHEPNITIAHNKDDEAEMRIKVILERPEEPQIESKEEQPLVLVKPLTIPCILVKP
ncbi:hypothetical protein Syun_019367 [Stephania yunnanensis]|uniref:Uncharacterized protein n=1 Tax=Stephania yunnanensis TaxID=152371 RepID=A0AAP0NXY0_9MAGN